MLEAVKYVIKENSENLFRIYSISKYEVLADMRDSKLGLFWNFANPIIQVLTYWFVFGLVLNRKSVDGIEYIWWMLGGMVVWFFISPCITAGCNAIFSKINIITKMKFPVSVLPATVVRKRKRICAESNVNTAEKESPCLRQQSVKISRISREFMETVF